MMDSQQSRRVLVVLNSICLYGLERAVLETFSILRPDVRPQFLIPLANQRYERPLLDEIRARQLNYSFFSDADDWPRLGKSELVSSPFRVLWALLRGNIDVLRACRKCDVLYVPSITAAYLSILAMLYLRLARPGRKRVLYHFHDLVLEPSWCLRMIDRLVTGYIHNTQVGFELCARANDFISDRSNQGVPPLIEQRRYAENQEADRELQGFRNIVFVGQVSRHKGVDLLLEAFERICFSYDDVRLHLVGGVAVDFNRELPKWLETSPAAEKARCWGYRKDVYRFFENAWVHVMPTPSSRVVESFGRSTVEAMSCGVPTVCFASGALVEIVTHERTGLVCEEETEADLTRNLCRLLDDPGGLRADLARNAKRHYDEVYRDEVIRERWMKILRISSCPTMSARPTEWVTGAL